MGDLQDPYIGLIYIYTYMVYLQFRFLKWPLITHLDLGLSESIVYVLP